jgi:putative oxygen-independent coproporphyrinogen III oxidase
MANTTRTIPIVPAGPGALKATSSTGVRLTALPPLSLYVHIPWCVRKCPYCDFNSHEAKAEIPEEAYIEALTHDLEQALPQIWGRKVYTIFFGGGTPSLLSPKGLDTLLMNLRARLPLEHCSEITLEANPGTFESAKFESFRASGVNRLSIGVQSFNRKHLQALGRIHNDDEAHRAIEIAHRYFDNFNLDLMYALPGQTMDEAMEDINAAITAKPTHISAYQLTLEPNTLFHRYPPELPGDDLAEEMQSNLESRLREAGYANYETSAFAQPSRQCAHNVNYWRLGDYLGIGAGAASKISLPDRIVRSMRHKQPKAYMEGVATGRHILEENDVALKDLPFEFMMNALRLTDGVPLRMFAERTGLPFATVEKEMREAEARGLIERDHENVRPTHLGRRFLNDLLQMFLPGEG